MDDKATGKLVLEDFFNMIDLIENNKGLTKAHTFEMPCWNKIRKFINYIFKFDKIAKSNKFEFLLTIVVLFNTVILLYYTFESDQDVLDKIDSIDNVLVYIYCGEVIIKLIGLGIYDYFDDGWNVMDFILTVVSVATNIALSFAKFARTAKAGKVFRNLRS